MKNNRPLGWTTLEEAKLLVEAGIDPNTADMWISPKVKYVGDSKQTPTYKTYPCWSLGALIELMPKEIRVNYLYVLNIFTTYKNKYCVSYHSICENIYAESESTLIESVVKCVIWLIQNNHIKKQE